MIKTVFSVRYTDDGPHVDSCISVEWPTHMTNDAINTLAQIRNEPPAQTMEMVLEPEVLKFLQDYPMLEMRARINMLGGPYVINTDEKPSDKFLLAYARQVKRNRKEKQ